METIRLSVNEKKTIQFPGLGTAGYKWKCITDDETKLKIESSLDSPPPVKPPIIGGSRNEIFTVTGLQKGTVHATFVQSRHWVPEAEPVKKIEYTIEVI
jgi:predicted secreted protein